MAFTRMPYDTCEYLTKCTENVSTLSYVLEPQKWYHCSPCRQALGGGAPSGNSVSKLKGNLVDLENDLFGITRELSRCPANKYIPNDTYIHPFNVHKTNNYERLNIKEKKHLRECQFFDIPGLPSPPPLNLAQCPK